MAERPSLSSVQEEFRQRLAELLGPRGLVSDSEEMAPYLIDERRRYRGRTPFVVRPGSTAEVAEVVRLAAAAAIPLVPQGGNTGLVGGSVPSDSGEEVLVSLGRMNRIRALDAENFTITAEAGCRLAEIQEAAAAADRLFPLSLGAEGTCQIGGNISTNAGGVQVLRYGNARELVLGLEVVLPDGRVWEGLRGLRKDNTGYDLKQLFIGAEGTLGIITAAVLKLFARPREIVTALVAVPDPHAAVRLLAEVRAASGESVTSFELMPRLGLEFALRHVEGCQDPLEGPHPWYVLAELFSGMRGGGLAAALEQTLAEAFEAGTALDGVVAASEAQRRALWRLREALVEAQRHEGGSIKHDLSVPLSAVPDFIAEANALVTGMIPGARPLPFGHLGDGNVHFNISQPPDADTAAFLARWEEVNARMHDLVRDFGGSISAEHGLGRMKVEENRRFKSEVEQDLMRRVKQALDPMGLMNPGKVL